MGWEMQGNCIACGSRLLEKRPASAPREITLKCGRCGLLATNPTAIKQRFFSSDNRLFAVERNTKEFSKYHYGLLQKFSGASGKRLLDVGAGMGSSSATARQLGFQVTCVESSGFAKKALEEKGFHVVGSVPESEGAYSVAYLSHILEHVEKPVAFLKEIHSKLEKNGTIVVRAPNPYSIEARLAAGQWCAWVPAEHYYHFSKESLGLLLKKSGFRSIAIKTCTRPFSYWPIPLFERHFKGKGIFVSAAKRVLFGSQDFVDFCSRSIGMGNELIAEARK